MNVRRAVGAMGAVVLVSAMAGGCISMPEEPTGEGTAATSEPYQMPTEASQIQAPDVPLVTAAEKERLGFTRPADVRNGDLQRKALEHRDEIFAATETIVKAHLGRKVTALAIYATYPYNSIDVTYRTVDEPYVASSFFMPVDDEGRPAGVESLVQSTDPHILEPLGVDWGTVDGLFAMAYRQELQELEDYLASTYRQYTTVPVSLGDLMPARQNGLRVDGSFESTNETPPVTYNAGVEAIYAAYQEDPTRTDVEWRALFEEYFARFDREKVQAELSVSLMLTDPDIEPTADMAREVGEDLRDNPLAEMFDFWVVKVSSNQWERDGIDAHIQYDLYFTRGCPDPGIDVWVNGYNG